MRSKCSSVSFGCGGVGGLGGLGGGGGGAVVGGCMLVYIYVGWAVWWLFGDWFGCGLECGLKETCEREHLAWVLHVVHVLEARSDDAGGGGSRGVDVGRYTRCMGTRIDSTTTPGVQ